MNPPARYRSGDFTISRAGAAVLITAYLVPTIIAIEIFTLPIRVDAIVFRRLYDLVLLGEIDRVIMSSCNSTPKNR